MDFGSIYRVKTKPVSPSKKIRNCLLYLLICSCPIFSTAQSRNTDSLLVIKGIVTDANGKPLSGATVASKGKKSITLTDADGLFVIRAFKGDYLNFSFVGY